MGVGCDCEESRKPGKASDSRVVDVHVSRLRAKLEMDPENPELIITARGQGYMFQRLQSGIEPASVSAA